MLFKKGLIIRGASQLKRYRNTKNEEFWWPAGQEIALAQITQDQVQVKQDSTLIRVTPISDVADGLFDGDLAFRLSGEKAIDIFGNSLDRFAEKAWNKLNTNSPEEEYDWLCTAFIAVFEIDEEKLDQEPPIFRGYLPMDERLLTVATSEEFWISS
jgi:hypothetical protein